jgi:two-component system cell cycle sensor histidine kinase/response regulator CckA
MPLRDESGVIIGTYGVSRDITKRKRAEEALRRERDLVAKIMETSPIGIVALDRRGEITFANAGAERVLGLTRNGAAGRRYDSLDLHATDYQGRPLPDEEFVQRYQQVMTVGQPLHDIRLVVENASGERIYLSINAAPVLAENGEPDGMIASIEDISERRRSEQALAEANQRFVSAFENAPIGMALTREGGELIQANPALCEILGYGRDELLTKRLRDLTHPDDVEESERRLGRLRAGDESDVRLEKRYIHADEHPVWVALAASAVRDEEGRPLYLINQIQDISERKRAEEERRLLEAELLQSQKMEAVGTLAGGVAHNFNNLLTAIGGYNALLLAKLDEGSDLRADAEEVQRATEKAAKVARELLVFSRREHGSAESLDLSKIVLEMTTLLRELTRSDIEIVTALAPDLDRVDGDRSQFEQVIVNLVLNACDAMLGGGTLTIETRNIRLVEPRSERDFELPAGDHVALIVRDSGHGMDEETRARVFEPFFTTKGPDRGTGLGLSTVYGIIKENGGHILAESQLGQGSTFTVFLPAGETS